MHTLPILIRVETEEQHWNDYMAQMVLRYQEWWSMPFPFYLLFPISLFKRWKVNKNLSELSDANKQGSNNIHRMYPSTGATF